MRRFVTLMFCSILALFCAPFFALAVTSTNYELNAEDDVVSTHHDLSSANYELEGSLGPYGGTTDSTNYTVESGPAFGFYCGDGFVDPGEDCDTGQYGTLLNGATCTSKGYTGGSLACSSTCLFDTSACTSPVTPPPSDGGGGSPGSTPPESVQLFNLPTPDAGGVVTVPFTYLTVYPISGRLTESGDRILINGSENGVQYSADNTWTAFVSLVVGENDIVIQVRNATGTVTEEVATIVVYRRERGDANGDGAVNDYDLSRLTRSWKTGELTTDFNSDGIVDDYDLSLLAAHWSV